VIAQPLVEATCASASRWPPFDLARYDRSPELAAYERAALARLITSTGRRGGQPQQEVMAAVQRLIEPLGDALAVFGIRADLRTRAVQILFREMAARATAY
jgi:hypothetical protein